MDTDICYLHLNSVLYIINLNLRKIQLNQVMKLLGSSVLRF